MREQMTMVREDGRAASKRHRTASTSGSASMRSTFSNVKTAGAAHAVQHSSVNSKLSVAIRDGSAISSCVVASVALDSGDSLASAARTARRNPLLSSTHAQSHIAARVLVAEN